MRSDSLLSGARSLSTCTTVRFNSVKSPLFSTHAAANRAAVDQTIPVRREKDHRGRRGKLLDQFQSFQSVGSRHGNVQDY